MTEYDAIIIGAGQSGGPLAFKLADAGWRVALIERKFLGGTCVNYGCTPTKTYVASAHAAHAARRSDRYGVYTGPVHVDLAEVRARKDDIVQRWRAGQQDEVDRREHLTLVRGHARFTGPGRIEVDGAMLASDRIVINTGTRPAVPDVPGLADVDYLTNSTILDLEVLPEHLVVLGAGYIGLEFAQMFARFGSRVTVTDHNDRVAAREDEDVSACIREALERDGVRFCLAREMLRAETKASHVFVTLRDDDGGEETLSGSHVLVAAGRTPNTDDLGLEAAGIEPDDAGFVPSDDHLRVPGVEGVWVMGDAKGGPQFTHISYDDHLVVYDQLCGGGERSIAGRMVPYALYTDPELGRVGLTAAQARDRHPGARVATIPLERVSRAVERGETLGLYRLVVDADDRILGAAMLAPAGGEVVQVLSALMHAGQSWRVLQDLIYIHPTLVEGFSTLLGELDG